MYIDWSQAEKGYVIKDMSTQKILHSIPSNIINHEGKFRSRFIMNRVKWHDNDRLLIVNKEGAERIINVKSNFEEEAFNMWPEFERENFPDKFHLFDEMRGISQFSIPDKIHRQLIFYKRAKNLFKL
jgi:hypothetical protein